MKVERVSYDVMTPSAARGILEAIYWKPAITWVVDRIHVMKPVKFINIRRNEVGCKLSFASVRAAMNSGEGDLSIAVEKERQQRAATLLRDVEYFLEAHFEPRTRDGENHGKHADIFKRHAKEGRCHHQPYFGCKEFPASFELWESQVPASTLKGDQDLGWMLFDIDFENDMAPMFFKGRMMDGVISIPSPRSEEVKK
jgi:CRISPR-associated protein Cas5d